MTSKSITRRVASAALLAGAGTSAILLAGCNRSSERPVSAAPAAPPVRKVSVVTPVAGDVARTITQPASLQGIEEATLFAKTAGYLKAVYVDKGDRVRAGQLLAVIESPELTHQADQARAGLASSQAATRSVLASKGRALADVSQAAAGVTRAESDVQQAEAGIGRAKADAARAEARLPKLLAEVRAADAEVDQTAEQRGQADAEVGRWQGAVRAAYAQVDAVKSTLEKAQANARLQQLTYKRLKAIQDKDAGLIAAQDVDVAKARMETSQSEVGAAQNRVEAARQEALTVGQQLEAARRSAKAALRKVDVVTERAAAARDEVRVGEQELQAARQQVKIAEAQRDAYQKQVAVADAQKRSLAEQVRVVDAQVAASREKSGESRSALAAATDLAGYTRITAPFDGLVTERLQDPGALVQNAATNQAAARGILHVVRDRTLRVLVPVPETAIKYARKGQPAAVMVDAYPNEPFRGVVSRYASAVDPKSRTMLTEVDIPNPGGRLHPGMYARVMLTLETHRNALSIPTEAVMGKDEDRFVYVVSSGKAHKTPVKVGVDDGKMAEITEGLQPGSQVVLTGRDTLVEGAPVKTEPTKMESGKK